MSASKTDIILVVEDEPAIGQICKKSLNISGFKVDIAIDGKVAKDRLETQDYTLILIDMRIPRINGRQLYWHIKERHPRMVNRVIFTTGDVLDGDTQSFLAEVKKPFLPKPFTPDQLRSIVTESLKQIEERADRDNAQPLE